jgi:hypothetical protein
MKTIRIIGIFAIAAAAGCVSSVEQRAAAPDSSGQAAHEIISAMHAAIPASPATSNGGVFEYN